jgi:hypothetical protein
MCHSSSQKCSRCVAKVVILVRDTAKASHDVVVVNGSVTKVVGGVVEVVIDAV